MIDSPPKREIFSCNSVIVNTLFPTNQNLAPLFVSQTVKFPSKCNYQNGPSLIIELSRLDLYYYLPKFKAL